MKTPWERHCEIRRRQAQLRSFDNWCLSHPRKADLVAIGAALVIFGASQLLRLVLDSIARLIGSVPQ